MCVRVVGIQLCANELKHGCSPDLDTVGTDGLTSSLNQVVIPNQIDHASSRSAIFKGCEYFVIK